MQISVKQFGILPSGEHAHLITLKNERNLEISLTNYGCIITSIKTPDSNGQLGEIVLGFNNLESYLDDHPYFGALVGRNANRISDAQYSYKGETHVLSKNENLHQLHGGISGLDKVVWDYEIKEEGGNQIIILKHLSPHGSEGFPGNLDCQVSFALKEDNSLEISYSATTDYPTPVNFTHHDYFNLCDGGASPITDHILKINSTCYTPNDKENIPIGQAASIMESDFDFSTFKNLGEMMRKKDGEIKLGSGYDDNFIVNKKEKGCEYACTLRDPSSRRQLDIWSTQECLQLYTGNFLSGKLKRDGAAYKHHHAVCLESQAYVDAVNQDNFPSTILLPDAEYREKTIYKFSCY